MNGLEPLTCWLQISCSANWATSAHSVFTCFIAQLAEHKLRLSAHLLLTRSISLNWATSACSLFTLLSACRSKISFSSSQDDSKGIWTPVTAVKGRCLNRLTMEPCFFSLSLFVFSVFSFLFPVFRTCFLMQKSSPSRARTYNPSVNSRVLYHWAIEDYSFSLRWNCYSFWSYTQNHTLKSFIRGDNSSFLPSWISPRPISISQLHVLPHFHLWPINLVVFKGS